MLKFGIVSVADASALKPAAVRARRVAVTVLEQIGGSPTPLEERLIAKIAKQFPAGDYNFLNTFAGRYASVDPEVAAEIRSHFAGRALIRVHDMAVSNGITSLELFEHLQDVPGMKFLATDLYNEAFVVGPPRGSWRVIFDSKHVPVQFVGRKMVISAFRPEPRRYVLNRILQWLLKKFVMPGARRMLSSADQSMEGSVRLLRLVHPRCIEMAAKDARFEFGRHDIMKPSRPASDVVRLMGVVQSLPREVLPSVFRGAGRSVVEGGLLVLGVREQGDRNRVPTTIFSRQGPRLVPVRDITAEYRYKQMVAEVDLGVAV